MEEKLKAVVLRAIDYKENDKLITLFSLEEGVVTAVARGVKKANAKLKFAAAPFCFCEYVLAKKGDKRTVVSAEIIESFYSLREDIFKLYAGSAALEFVYLFVKEGMENGRLFVLLMDFLKNLCFSEADAYVLLVKFLLEALALAGYEITVDKCAKCRKTIKNRAFFDFGIGGGICEDCRDGMSVEINPSTLKLLNDVNNRPFEELVGLIYPQIIRKKAVRLLGYYIEVQAGVTVRSIARFLLL